MKAQFLLLHTVVLIVLKRDATLSSHLWSFNLIWTRLLSIAPQN